MTSNKIYKTRSGIQPYIDDNNLPFKITTDDVERYMQHKLNIVVNGMRRKGLYNAEDIEIRVISIIVGSRCIPFSVVLPMDVLKKERHYRDPKMEIFHPNQDDINDVSTDIYEPVLKLFNHYMFDNHDIQWFHDIDWRRKYGVTSGAAVVLKKNSYPQIKLLNDGKMEKVAFIIDPIRVFRDMLKIKSDKTPFWIKIDDIEKNNTGIYSYYIRRTTSDSKSKSNFWQLLMGEL